MTFSANLRVVFRAPAGARRGYGHLVRCLSLARALGVRPLLALRGSSHASDVALALGADVLASPTPQTLRALAPDVVVIDDPSAAHARPWIDAARRAGAVVVTPEDLGLAQPDGDHVIDSKAAKAAVDALARQVRSARRFGQYWPIETGDLTKGAVAHGGWS
jgi:hypothetical protein